MSRKPRIAILAPRYGYVDRGVENFTKEFVSRLRNDFDITVFSQVRTEGVTRKVFCVPESNVILQKMYSRYDWLGEKLDRYFLNPLSVEMLTFSVSLFPRLLFGDYDLIFPQNGVWGAIICRLVRAVKRTPFIYRSAGGKEPPIVRQKPDVYVATTPEVEGWIRKYRPKVEVVLIPNGVNVKKFTPAVEPAELSLERPIYICVTALIPAKRVDLAIRAVARLERGSLLVLGEGPLKEELSKLGREQLGEQRFLMGVASYEEMPSFYTAGDVFTLPSAEEPFGIAYLEAMACGLPVVAPADESRRYIVGSAGVLCEVTNLEGYSGALKKAAEIDFRNWPRVQAGKFTWEKVASAYKRLLREKLCYY